MRLRERPSVQRDQRHRGCERAARHDRQEHAPDFRIPPSYEPTLSLRCDMGKPGRYAASPGGPLIAASGATSGALFRTIDTPTSRAAKGTTPRGHRTAPGSPKMPRLGSQEAAGKTPEGISYCGSAANPSRACCRSSSAATGELTTC